MLRVTYFSPFLDQTGVHGGYKWTGLLVELLQKCRLDLTLCNLPNALHPSYPLSSLLSPAVLWPIAVNSLSDIGLWTLRSRLQLCYTRGISSLTSQSITDNFDLAIVDCIHFYLPLLRKLELLGIPIIAGVHNIESQVPERMRYSQQIRGLTWESEQLRRCQASITISQEDRILLEKLNIPCTTILPFPTQSVLQNLLSIRSKREQSSTKTGVLLLGTTLNPPTRIGMEEIISYWTSNSYLSAELGKLIVVGVGSESLRNICTNDSVLLLGESSNDELYRLMSNCIAALCYQKQGSGALTRIADLIMAGVPVVANNHALRSYHGTAGTFALDHLSKLQEALRKARAQNIAPMLARDLTDDIARLDRLVSSTAATGSSVLQTRSVVET